MASGDPCGICGSLMKDLFRDHTEESCREACIKKAYAEGFSAGELSFKKKWWKIRYEDGRKSGFAEGREKAENLAAACQREVAIHGDRISFDSYGAHIQEALAEFEKGV